MQGFADMLSFDMLTGCQECKGYFLGHVKVREEHLLGHLNLH